MSQQPPDPAALAAAYRAARYVAGAPTNAPAVAVGATAPMVEAAIEAGSFAFITAWNPMSRNCNDARNRKADASMLAELDALGLRRWPMQASDAAGGHAEPGWLLADPPLAELDRLARKYRQAGTLYWPRGGSVRLRMYFPRPASDRATDTDWLE